MKDDPNVRARREFWYKGAIWWLNEYTACTTTTTQTIGENCREIKGNDKVYKKTKLSVRQRRKFAFTC